MKHEPNIWPKVWKGCKADKYPVTTRTDMRQALLTNEEAGTASIRGHLAPGLGVCTRTGENAETVSCMADCDGASPPYPTLNHHHHHNHPDTTTTTLTPPPPRHQQQLGGAGCRTLGCEDLRTFLFRLSTLAQSALSGRGLSFPPLKLHARARIYFYADKAAGGGGGVRLVHVSAGVRRGVLQHPASLSSSDRRRDRLCVSLICLSVCLSVRPLPRPHSSRWLLSHEWLLFKFFSLLILHCEPLTGWWTNFVYSAYSRWCSCYRELQRRGRSGVTLVLTMSASCQRLSCEDVCEVQCRDCKTSTELPWVLLNMEQLIQQRFRVGAGWVVKQFSSIWCKFVDEWCEKGPGITTRGDIQTAFSFVDGMHLYLWSDCCVRCSEDVGAPLIVLSE